MENLQKTINIPIELDTTKLEEAKKLLEEVKALYQEVKDLIN